MFIHKRRAQVSLENAVAFIGICVLLFGTLNIFLWINKRIVRRQHDYESTRVAAGSTSTNNDDALQVPESSYPKLNVFKRR